MTDPQEECPRFETCSCNVCPLHKDYTKLKTYPTDPQIKCKVSKTLRLRIGKKYNLQNQGLKPRELFARVQSDRLKQDMLKSIWNNQVTLPLNEKQVTL